MKLSNIKRNVAAEKSGRWIDVKLPEFDGVSFKVRGLGNPDYEALKARLFETRSPADREKDLSADEIAQLLSETILLGWRGILNDDNTPLVFDAATAMKLLTDPDYGDFRSAVIWAAQNVGRDRYASAEQDAKN